MNESEKEDKPRISTVVVIWGDIETEEKKRSRRRRRSRKELKKENGFEEEETKWDGEKTYDALLQERFTDHAVREIMMII